MQWVPDTHPVVYWLLTSSGSLGASPDCVLFGSRSRSGLFDTHFEMFDYYLVKGSGEKSSQASASPAKAHITNAVIRTETSSTTAEIGTSSG